MGILLWIVRVLAFLLLLRIVLNFFFGRRPATAPPRGRRGPFPGPGGPAGPAPSKEGGELVRDPQCGTYVPKARAIAASVGSQTSYFCSTACRDAYLSQASHA
jgi:YHS domain-containing protein